MRMLAPRYYTADMVRALIDESRPWPRYELVHGELLVSPAPNPAHQVVAANVYDALTRYLGGNPLVRTLWSPADISYGRDDVLVQPDVFVLRRAELSAKWHTVGRLVLAVEVLSPSTARFDRFTKRRLYQEIGADEYWVVDLESRSVEVWTPDAHFPRVETETLRWTAPGATEPLVLAAAEIFRDL